MIDFTNTNIKLILLRSRSLNCAIKSIKKSAVKKHTFFDQVQAFPCIYSILNIPKLGNSLTPLFHCLLPLINIEARLH